MTGRSASSGNSFHQRDAIGPGQYQVQQDQRGLLRLDEAGHVLRVAGHLRGVPRVSERVPHVPQGLRVVVHHQDARPLLPGPPRVASGPGGGRFAAPLTASSATGIVKVTRVPWSAPSLSAQMRPPSCAKTRPF